eukprot:TRINITY_DN1888_c0_g1_i2.p1 TRINITY_DN1888_c0_g1~~TRINITY_DN1888_c0_g1_i2.p1  ORF type:complete len:127 (-),score=17.86 TRINITY_DN1888_c0_g1_i2:160-540(-)
MGNRSQGHATQDNDLEDDEVSAFVKSQIQKNPVMIWSKTTCGYCTKVKTIFRVLEVPFSSFELDKTAHGTRFMKVLYALTKRNTVPNVFIKGRNVGGCDDVVRMYKSGELEALIASHEIKYNNKSP